MIRSGKFNIDAGALKRRIQAHGRYGSNDLNAWIFSHVSLQPASEALDLGCGTGKQTLAMADAVGDSGRVLSVDISQDALDALLSGAQSLGIANRITTIRSPLDELGPHIEGLRFSLVLASYSLYYAQNPAKLFAAIHQGLHPAGELFFCGPAKDNNHALKEFHWALRGESAPPGTDASAFMEGMGVDLSKRYFGNCEVFHFSNALRFDSAEALYDYWSSYNLYDEKLASAFRFKAAEHFESHPVFETTKKITGVKAIKK